MKILPVPPIVIDPYFEAGKNWQIQQQTTRYGKKQTTMTTYYLENGGKLATFHYWNNGKKEGILKELYDGAWQLVKSKLIDLKDGVRKIKEKY
jgi:antitoxin component YwqK of YwqJK toxin-antitoxin module